MYKTFYPCLSLSENQKSQIGHNLLGAYQKNEVSEFINSFRSN